ncbi:MULTISPECIES: hypothetical protein [Caldanaerobacter]|jgi:hypothetical protein|uniref:Uncharacterized protein n=4 Tax=Caldanaerobacter subterraneus TaxID=911092 RepID=Q8R908_CALS4|nr:MULTISPECIES: hypothetical protein [Caldanaerobacter]AAM25015.1 hypothetical protein TTE1824 [Caldanaerobacter subterraneus subsp. tengcongensis MB4]ERM93294.1 hypothetical protein O163_00650 [Caldanaerobacter subterraneus subsp. yonseiensis KB-1]KKC29297.1 hypothetical protein CDSM653_01689 [Caldanaerobacter subterraneus subsp. pacificus DSM 12653]MBE3578487.1 hypothetical protein [Caldanaerobacter subterraneus]MCS3915402.1 hypothetical protein [Caldanaerobacter subterraneus subsp. tengcon
MKNTSRYGRDYYYYKDYERLYANYDASKLEIIKKLIEAGEYEKLKAYRGFDTRYREKGENNENILF